MSRPSHRLQVDSRSSSVQLAAHVVGNLLVLLQRLEPGAFHRAAVHEQILGAVVGQDETEAALDVEGSDDTGRHERFSFETDHYGPFPPRSHEASGLASRSALAIEVSGNPAAVLKSSQIGGMAMKRIASWLAILIASLAGGPAGAQQYPSQPVKIILGFAPCGGSQFIARGIAPKPTKRLGKLV